ncbi:hypothetical protein LSM04_004052 [Trypanosoma melophagium]|uniref:uncharacterized protein n=1 Tax=Trypanosoma melophagium TaxID=715481 RepID=UPI00351A0E3C|nr:hypothetical protein LSM04_004052 [Trypanosoma melophagium]
MEEELAAALRDLAAGRSWRNVQPVVAAAAGLLLRASTAAARRLAELNAIIADTRSAVSLVAEDARLKERRYRHDRDAVDRLQQTVEAYRRESQQLQTTVLLPALAEIQQEVDGLAAGLQATKRGKNTNRKDYEEGEEVEEGENGGGSGVYSRETDGAMLREMVREVKLLRNQWKQMMRSHFMAPLPQSSSLSPSPLTPPPPILPAQQRTIATACKRSGMKKVHSASSRLWMDCSVARWQWCGGHISAAMLSPDVPIPWNALNVRNTLTGEWLTADAAPPEFVFRQQQQQEEGQVIEKEKEVLCDVVRFPFAWRPQSPSVIEILQDGIYHVTVCIISICNRGVGTKSHAGTRGVTTSALPFVTLRINNNTVFSFFSGGSTCYTVQSGMGTAPTTANHNKAAAASRQTCACSRRPCNCGAEVTFTTTTVAEYLRLPIGSTVSIHSYDSSNTTAVHEALLEMERMAG